MDPTRWSQLRALFEQALDLDEAGREALLDQHAADPDLVARARRLLRADGTDHTPMEIAAPAVVEFLQPAALLAELGGASVEPYRVLRALGRGGMGAVYLAERADGAFERKVALKVVHGGFDSEEVMRRFHSERRILAGLEHPNIARMYDAGVASDGRPFLIMEYVEGEPIDRYMDRNALDLRARITLFGQVCEAVAYAHGNLVIHRDLKPSNILVGPDGTVKLLDFGIARLADPSQEAEPRTRTGLRLLTPEYASPEQLRGERLATSSDVYSLGSVLYEVLTGHRTFTDASTALAHAFEPETAASISPPSRRAGAQGAALRGDLDRILMKSLARDPALRYDSVASLADDLRRYLDGRPVLAQPLSLRYRSAKFVRRHRIAVVTFALALAGLIATTFVAVEQARRAEAERGTAEGVTAFLEDLFRQTDPRGGQMHDTTSLETLLAVAALRVRDEAGPPATRARLLYVLGSIYRNLSRNDLAAPLFREAIERNRSLHGPGHRDEIQSRGLLGLHLVESGAFDEGRAQLDTALAFQVAAEGEESMLTWRLRERIAQAYATAQRNAEALPHVEAVVAATRRAEPFEPARLASALNLYGSVLGQLGRWPEAVPVLEEAVDQLASSPADSGVGSRALDEGVQRSNLASVLMRLGRIDDAERHMRRGLELIDAGLPERHQLRAQGDVRLAEILSARERTRPDPRLRAEADSLFRSGIAQARELPELRNSMMFLLHSYGRVLWSWERLSEAEGRMREALGVGQVVFGEGHALVQTPRSDLGRVLAEQGRIEEGSAHTEAALAALRVDGAPASGSVNAALNHAKVLLLAGRPSEALALLEPLESLAVSAFGEQHGMVAGVRETIAEARAASASRPTR